MNYAGNEELREDIARLANDVHELHQRMKLLEQKYLWNTENLTHRFAGQTLHTAGAVCSVLHQHVYDIDLIFSD